MTVRSRRSLVALVIVAFVSAGCATGTRTGRLGVLPGGEPLVTLVVTEDPSLVGRECPFTIGSVLGCQTSRKVAMTEGADVRVVKIVRYTDRVPSALAFEIDIHELCHAIAALQPIRDPCHAENGGVAATDRSRRSRLAAE